MSSSLSHLIYTTLPLLAMFCLCNRAIGRQIRINRNTAIIEDDDSPLIEAEVHEIIPTPYPPSGYRPSQAFLLPTEAESQFNNKANATTTELSYDSIATKAPSNFILTTLSSDITTQLPSELTTTTDATNILNETITVASAIPDNDVPSLWADEPAKAPYPPAGYRPIRVFRLPTEISGTDCSETIADEVGNSTNPACGVSINPLAPRPADGSKDDPDAERVTVTVPIGSVVVMTRAPIAIPLVAVRSRPLIINRRRPNAYIAQL